MATEGELRELVLLCSGAKEHVEFGLTYILLPQLRLPSECSPATVDALLCLNQRDGYLPLNSKYREAGKEDVIQTFDPLKHFGANQARFQNYVNLCLTNKFRSLYSKRRKDALFQPGNTSLDAQREWDNPRAVDDEFCHSHSVHLRRAANASVLRKLESTFQIQKARPQLRERVIAEQRVRESAVRSFENLRLVQSTVILWNRVELYNEVWNQPLVKLSRKYGISDVRLGKVCRKLIVPHPGRGYWAKKAVGQTVEQVPLPEFKDAPVVKRLIKKIEAETSEARQDRASKRTLRKSLRKQFLKNGLGIGL